MPWDVGAEDGPVRRLTLLELTAALEAAGLDARGVRLSLP